MGNEGMTSREFLAITYPPHEWHTIIEIIELNKLRIKFTCSCGSALSVTPALLSDLSITYKEASMALRNVPNTKV